MSKTLIALALVAAVAVVYFNAEKSVSNDVEV